MLSRSPFRSRALVLGLTVPLLLAAGCGGDVEEDGIAARAALADQIGGDVPAEGDDPDADPRDGCPVIDSATFAQIQEDLGGPPAGDLQ